MKQNQYQRGAAGSFIIIAVVLTLIALVVLYGARQFMSQQSAPITAQDIAPQSDQQTAQAPAASKSNATNPETSANTPQQSAPQSASQSSGATDQQVSGAPRQSTPSASQSSAGASSQHLPQTGPVSAAASAVGLAALAALTLSYMRSRHLV